MTKLIYLEKTIQHHKEAKRICQQFPQAPVILCDHYGEIFNRRAQNFRQQKADAALILAEKTGRRVLPTPESFGIGSVRNFYFSHMLNCIYDCRYCFLQGMYPSAHRVLFINYHAFMDEIDHTIATYKDDTCYFFSGYDGDSLALDPVSHFIRHFVPFFQARPTSFLELRTKSSNVRPLLNLPASDNIIVAFSLLPEKIANAVDFLTPAYEKRLQAIEAMAKKGFPIGLRFDPMIYCDDFEQVYPAMIHALFKRIDPKCVHSVSIGTLRFPNHTFKAIKKLYPTDPLLNHPLNKRGQMVSYAANIEELLHECLKRTLGAYMPLEHIFHCQS